MKKIVSLGLIMSFCSILVVNYASASPVTYNVISGADPNWNQLSGSLTFESSPIKSTDKYNTFSVTDFNVHSDTGMVSGNGYFDIWYSAGGRGNTGDCYGKLTVTSGSNTIGLQNETEWIYQWNIFFYDQDSTEASDYRILPDLIGLGTVNSHRYSPYSTRDGYWLPANLPNSYDLVLARAAVPVPASLLLFGSGLLGLAGFRKKLMK